MPAPVPTHRRPQAATIRSRRCVLVVVGVLLVFVTTAAVGLVALRETPLGEVARDRPEASYAAGAGGEESPPPTSGRRAEGRWGDVLQRLDRRREQAWRTARPRALATVFAPGSAVLRRDVARLAAYLRRGFRVSGVTMHFERIRVVARRPGRVRLQVVDRLQATAVHQLGGVATRALPTDRPSRHLITVARMSAGWRIADVTWPGHRPPRPG